jgi:hypothetical protein
MCFIGFEGLVLINLCEIFALIVDYCLMNFVKVAPSLVITFSRYIPVNDTAKYSNEIKSRDFFIASVSVVFFNQKRILNN